MNQLAPEISIGDAIRAWRILSPANAEELRDLCSMLGLIEEPVQFQGKKDGVIEEVIKTDEVSSTGEGSI